LNRDGVRGIFWCLAPTRRARINPHEQVCHDTRCGIYGQGGTGQIVIHSKQTQCESVFRNAQTMVIQYAGMHECDLSNRSI